jgi:hypothetical protein
MQHGLAARKGMILNRQHSELLAVLKIFPEQELTAGILGGQRSYRPERFLND